MRPTKPFFFFKGFAPLFALLLTAHFAADSVANERVIVLDFNETSSAGLLALDSLPKQPSNRVADEMALLTDATKAQLEKTLLSAANTEIFLVVLENSPTEPIEKFGNEILRRWLSTTSKLAALVVAQQAPEERAYVLLAGRSLDTMDIEQLTGLGTAALGIGSPDQNIAEAGASIASGLVPALETFSEVYQESIAQKSATPVETASSHFSVSNGAETADTGPSPAGIAGGKTTTSKWDILSAKIDWVKVKTLSAIAGAVILAIALLVLVPRLMRNRRIVFPKHAPRRRFDAPYAGGSNARISYSR